MIRGDDGENYVGAGPLAEGGRMARIDACAMKDTELEKKLQNRIRQPMAQGGRFCNRAVSAGAAHATRHRLAFEERGAAVAFIQWWWGWGWG